MYYVLVGHEPRPASFEEWMHWFERFDRKLFQTTIGEAFVSTVFLGLDHGFRGDEPLIFETMIFGGPRDSWQERCSTWEQAEAMHKRACDMVYGDIPVQAVRPAPTLDLYLNEEE